jgi:site-specific recombinase XerD
MNSVLDIRSARSDVSLQGSCSWFLTALEEAKFAGYCWHCNRHAFASKLVKAGVGLRSVSELLGHRTAQMTKRYAHLSVNHKQAGVERISAVQSAIKTAINRRRVPRASRKSL